MKFTFDGHHVCCCFILFLPFPVNWETTAFLEGVTLIAEDLSIQYTQVNNHIWNFHFGTVFASLQAANIKNAGHSFWNPLLITALFGFSIAENFHDGWKFLLFMLAWQKIMSILIALLYQWLQRKPLMSQSGTLDQLWLIGFHERRNESSASTSGFALRGRH